MEQPGFMLVDNNDRGPVTFYIEAPQSRMCLLFNASSQSSLAGSELSFWRWCTGRHETHELWIRIRRQYQRVISYLLDKYLAFWTPPLLTWELKRIGWWRGVQMNIIGLPKRFNYHIFNGIFLACGWWAGGGQQGLMVNHPKLTTRNIQFLFDSIRVFGYFCCKSF